MKVVKWIVAILLLAGVSVLCFFRWQVWFGNPVEPEYKSDTLSCSIHCFGEDSVPRFVLTEAGWQDTLQPDRLRLVVFGDIHNQMDSTDYATALRTNDTVDAYVQLGDWMERAYFYYEQQLFHQLIGTGADSLPVICCPGNHEYKKSVIQTLQPLWTEIFHHPLNGPQRFIGSTYYVDFPNLRLIALDSNGLQRLSDYTIVLTWLKAAMADANGRFTIVIMHHPIYSSGKGRFNPLLWALFRPTLRHADCVFTGHDHGFLQREHFFTLNSSRKVYTKKETDLPEDSQSVVQQPLDSRNYALVDVFADSLCVQIRALDSLNDVQALQIPPFVYHHTSVAQ
ncbi:MAG: metallophosphoesterase [Paludibacteraceae bacterium]|nr:metallophosphoesterase [Paludibacteraceae bacterium]